MQAFLPRSSILDRLNASLAEAVTALEDGEATLDHLDQANLFVVPLDDERHWYRYHQLFGELLRHRLQRRQPELVPEFHRRASQWFERRGHVHDAMRHALAAADEERAARLIERGATETVAQVLTPEPDARLSRSGPSEPLPEPLSEREIAVLHLIAAGCSNREIADRLVIALSTVKWYVNATYGKLQVDCRTKAVNRARSLGLVGD